MAKQKTKHQKEVELANAGATKYGINIESAPIPNLEHMEALASARELIAVIITSDSDEKTKRMALEALDKSIPAAPNISIDSVNLNM